MGNLFQFGVDIRTNVEGYFGLGGLPTDGYGGRGRYKNVPTVV